jgi:hypothetical protein
MLLVPLTCCILACEFFRRIRPHFSERAIEYAQFAAAAFLFFCFALGPGYLDNRKALFVAVQKNIETTNAFHNELQLVLRAAEKSPEIPIILEAYGPGAFEPVFSLSAYLTALGARNPVSVRVHSDGNSYGNLTKACNNGCPLWSRPATPPLSRCGIVWRTGLRAASASGSTARPIRAVPAFK